MIFPVFSRSSGQNRASSGGGGGACSVVLTTADIPSGTSALTLITDQEAQLPSGSTEGNYTAVTEEQWTIGNWSGFRVFEVHVTFADANSGPNREFGGGFYRPSDESINNVNTTSDAVMGYAVDGDTGEIEAYKDGVLQTSSTPFSADDVIELIAVGQVPSGETASDDTNGVFVTDINNMTYDYGYPDLCGNTT